MSRYLEFPARKARIRRGGLQVVSVSRRLARPHFVGGAANKQRRPLLPLATFASLKSTCHSIFTDRRSRYKGDLISV